MQDVVTAAKKNPIYAGIELDVDKGATTKDAFHTGLGKYDEETLGGRGGLIWVGSGGMATAKKFYTPIAAKEWDEEVQCAQALCDDLGFFSGGQVVVNLLSGSSYPIYSAIQRLMEGCGASVLPCDGHSSDDYVVRIAQKFGANAIVATTNRLAQLAWYLQGEGAMLPVTTLVLYGNIPHASQMSAFETVFGSDQHGKLFKPVVGAIYGTAETGIIGFSPPLLRDLQTILLVPTRTLEIALKPVHPQEIPSANMEDWAEVYENQRKFPLVGWKNKLMKKDPSAWTDAALKPMRRSEVKLPNAEEHGIWGFSGKWECDKNWQYAWDWNGPWMPGDELIACGSPHGGKREKPKIRRRKWRVKLVRTQAPEEMGSGRLLCSMIQRKRVPVCRYDTGDVGKLKQVTFAAEKRRALWLAGRQHLCFSLGESQVFISELEPLLSGFLDFQVIHDLKEDEGGSRDMLTLRVLPHGKKGVKKLDVDAETKKRLAMDIREVISRSRPSAVLPEYHIEVQAVSPSELKTCENSGKLRRLIDMRGTGGVPHIRLGSDGHALGPTQSGNTSKLRLRPPSVSSCSPSVAPSVYNGNSDDDDLEDG